MPGGLASRREVWAGGVDEGEMGSQGEWKAWGQVRSPSRWRRCPVIMTADPTLHSLYPTPA